MNNILLILICGILVSCGQNSFETNDELLEFVSNPDNGYSETKKINDININVSYRPTDLLVQQERGNKIINEEVKDSLRNKYNKYLYFNLSYSKNDEEILSSINESREKFISVQNILTFGMKDNVFLETDSADTIRLIEYNYPRMYGMAKATTMLFVFEKSKAVTDSKELIMTIKDIGIKTGDVKFKFNTRLIKNQPVINFR